MGKIFLKYHSSSSSKNVSKLLTTFFFLETLSEKIKTLYNGNIRGKLEQWSNSKFSQKEKDDLVQKEMDTLFEVFSNFCFITVNLGVDHDLIRRFMIKMCQMTNVDEKNTKIIMTLVSNMTRANDLEIKPENIEIKMPEPPTKRSEVKKKKSLS